MKINPEEAFEKWWETQLVPPDDQGSWLEIEKTRELGSIASEILPAIKMYSRKAFIAGMKAKP